MISRINAWLHSKDTPNAESIRNLRIMLLLILGAFGLLFLVNRHWQLPWMDPAIALVVAALLLNWGLLLERGHIQASVFCIALTVLCIATVGGIFGLGIHDIAIVMFPVIVLISSMLLERRYIAILGGIAVGLIISLGLSERYSIVYPSLEIHGDPGEYFIVILAIVISGIWAVVNAEQNRRNLEQVHYNALHDYLTGLPNRALLQDRLAQIIRQQKRKPDYHYAVLFIDLDGFKNVNDTLGHHWGDILIIETGKRLQKILRPFDAIARLGGDEFILVLTELRNVAEAAAVAERVQAEIQEPFQLSEGPVTISASIGIVYGAGYEQIDDLFIDADLAMYRAKALGKAQCQVFDSSMRTGAQTVAGSI